MTSATRGRVHRSVEYPWAVAPFRSRFRSRVRCRAVKRGGLPGGGLARRASVPPVCTSACQRLTEAGEQPIFRATSLTPRPSSSSATARRRRASSTAGVPYGLIHEKVQLSHYLRKSQSLHFFSHILRKHQYWLWRVLVFQKEISPASQ